MFHKFALVNGFKNEEFARDIIQQMRFTSWKQFSLIQFY